MIEDNQQEKLSKQKKDIERMITLRQKEENKEKLTQQEMRELMNLSRHHKGYAEMTAAEMTEAFEKKSHTKNVDVVSNDDLDPVLQAYKEKYSKEKWYQEPETKDGKTSLAFPSEEDAAQFFREQAEAGHSFVVIDGKTNQVMAYSDGDGKLYHSNGNEFQSDELLQPGEDTLEAFLEQHQNLGRGNKP